MKRRESDETGKDGEAAYQIGREICFRVYGDPGPQGSKSPKQMIGRDGRLKWGVRESSKKVKPWRSLVADVAWIEARRANWGIIDSGPVLVEFWFFKMPPKFPKWKAKGLPETQPDWDKLARSTGDALSGVLYGDDRQICEGVVAKRFGPPGAWIRVAELIELARPVRKIRAKG